MILYVAFKGIGNSSNKLVSMLIGEKVFLTNSVSGLEKDINRVQGNYSAVYMFGLDKFLKGNVRIEKSAISNYEVRESILNIDKLIQELNKNGINAEIGNKPKKSLCNEAYWHMLGKYNGHVLFFHIPSIKYINSDIITKIKPVLSLITDENMARR